MLGRAVSVAGDWLAELEGLVEDMFAGEVVVLSINLKGSMDHVRVKFY